MIARRQTGTPRRSGLLALTLGMAALGLTLLGSAAPVQAQSVLKFVPHADLKNLDPIWTTAYITRNHGYMIYDVLFAMNDKLEPQPQMVDSWKVSADGLTYTFTLREGLRWHDGSAVTSADCIASIERWGKRDGMGQKLMDVTAEMKAVNARTFTLKLKEPYGLVLDSLGKISSNVPFMMPAAVAKTDAFTQIDSQIGSGPFIFKKDEWVPGNKVVWVKNTNYKPRSESPSFAAGGKVVKVDRVEWIWIDDNATKLAALNAGEVDWWENPPVDLLPALQSNSDVRVEVIDKLGQQGWLRPNHLWPPFNNPKAREALLWMVNQEDYLRAIIGDPNYFTVCAAYFVCGTPYETNAGGDKLLAQDLEKARALVKESGYDGYPIIVMDPTDNQRLRGATLVTVQLLRKVGFNVEVQAMDWSTLTSRRAEQKDPKKGGWNIFHTSWNAPDVLTPINNIGVSGGGPEKAWFGWPADSSLESLRDQWARTSDPSKKKAIATQVQERAYQIVPYVNFGQWFQPQAWRTNLEGLINAPVPFMWNVSKK